MEKSWLHHGTPHISFVISLFHTTLPTFPYRHTCTRARAYPCTTAFYPEGYGQDPRVLCFR